MTTSTSRPRTAVLCGTGKTGRRVADRLTGLGASVRIGSRSGRPAFDWADRSTWPGFVEGTDAVYLTYFPDLAVPSAIDDVAAFCAVAADAGLRKIVALSGRGEDSAVRAEQVIQSSGLSWTILRATWFAQNFSEGSFLEPVLSGLVELPVGAVREPFVDADDIADVAVAALTDPRHEGRVYELTGPRSLTFAEAVAEIGVAADIPVKYQSVSIGDYTAGLNAAGLPADMIDLLGYLFTEVLDGRNQRPADGVRAALGRDATDFRDFARAAAASGVWATGKSRTS